MCNSTNQQKDQEEEQLLQLQTQWPRDTSAVMELKAGRCFVSDDVLYKRCFLMVDYI